MIQLDIKPGDTILTGKWKNKKVIVKSITKDEYGNPLINNQPIMKIRVPKWYQQTENKMKKSELRNIIREELLKEAGKDEEFLSEPERSSFFNKKPWSKKLPDNSNIEKVVPAFNPTTGIAIYKVYYNGSLTIDSNAVKILSKIKEFKKLGRLGYDDYLEFHIKYR